MSTFRFYLNSVHQDADGVWPKIEPLVKTLGAWGGADPRDGGYISIGIVCATRTEAEQKAEALLVAANVAALQLNSAAQGYTLSRIREET
jgi:hypothetical protein